MRLVCLFYYLLLSISMLVCRLTVSRQKNAMNNVCETAEH